MTVRWLLGGSNFFLTFNWRIIALQGCVSFCHTTAGISCKYTYVPSLSSLHPTPLSQSTGWVSILLTRHFFGISHNIISYLLVNSSVTFFFNHCPPPPKKALYPLNSPRPWQPLPVFCLSGWTRSGYFIEMELCDVFHESGCFHFASRLQALSSS